MIEKLKLAVFAIAILAANVAFFHFALPDTVFGRLASWVISAFEKDAPADEKPLNLTFSCKHPLPEFTLGPYSNPSEKELDTLCQCIWQELPAPAKDFAKAISDGSISSPSDATFGAFTANFSLAIRRCDGMNT